MKYFVTAVFGIVSLFIYVDEADAFAMPNTEKPTDHSPIIAYDKTDTNEHDTNSLTKRKSDTTAAEVALQLATGKRYVWGKNTQTEVDCSAFTQQFIKRYKNVDISRTTYLQVKEGKKVMHPNPGDLVFFNDYSHVGVYVGDGMMVDALNPKEGVGLRKVSYVYGTVDGYYQY